MLLRSHRPRSVRRGAAAVEFAMISVLLFSMLFGIFEYCRLIFALNVTSNACRDAARFASCRTGGGTLAGEPVTILDTDVQGVVTTGQFNGTTYGTGMLGIQNSISGYTVSVFKADPAGLAQNPAVVQPDPTGSSWTNAGFQEKIAVQVTGNYQNIAPGLLGLNPTIPFKVTVMVSSEGN